MKSYLRRMWLKAWPKLAVAVFGAILYIFAVNLSGDIKELLINVAATLIAIPVIVVTYELWNDKSHKALNENVYRYGENEMGQAMLEIKAQMEMLLEGHCVYFDAGDIVLDDSGQGNYILRIRDEAKFCTTKTARPINESIRLILMAGLRLMNPISRNLTLVQSLQ